MNISANISQVGHYSTVISFDLIWSIKRNIVFWCAKSDNYLSGAYSSLMNGTLIAMVLDLVLPDTILVVALCKKNRVQSISGIMSSMPTSTVSVELFVLSFFLVEAKYTDPFLINSMPPIWISMLVVCTATKQG